VFVRRFLVYTLGVPDISPVFVALGDRESSAKFFPSRGAIQSADAHFHSLRILFRLHRYLILTEFNCFANWFVSNDVSKSVGKRFFFIFGYFFLLRAKTRCEKVCKSLKRKIFLWYFAKKKGTF